MTPQTLNGHISTVFAFQDGLSAISRVWHYLNQYYEIGSVKMSVTSVAEGLLVLVVTVFLSRVLTRLLQRRIAKRAYLDPGLQYTLGRLTQYLIFILGVLLAIKVASPTIDLTSIAVVFTALSVGIGFGLQYIAADIASGFAEKRSRTTSATIPSSYSSTAASTATARRRTASAAPAASATSSKSALAAASRDGDGRTTAGGRPGCQDH